MANLVVGAPKVHSDELAKWHESNPVEELFYAQKEIARFLELGYLALRDHPEVAAEIRNTAHKSRTQHVLTVGLFKKFVVTASSVVNTYCPMMMDALELQDIEILKEAFGQVLEMCVDMKKETEDSRNRPNDQLKTSQEADKLAKTTYDRKRKVTKTLYERKQQTLNMIANIEALDLRKSSFGDISSFKEAITQLGNVDKQFMRIISFWDSMATMLKHLYQNQTAARVYLKKIEDDRYAEKFLTSIDKAEKTWNRIGLVCQKYVQDNDEVILNVYGFLSAPVDNMSDEEVQKRKKSLIRDMKDEAEQLDDVE